MRKLNVLIPCVMVAGIVLTGCSTWGGSHDDRTAGRVVDDTKITKQVQSKLASEPVYKFDDVDVKTFSGVVQLSGFVNTDDQKRRAGELAQSVAGVAQVVNNITLKPQAGPTPTGRTDEPPPIQSDANPPARPVNR